MANTNLVTNLNADLLDGNDSAAFEKTANKGAANGYASLDSNAKVPTSQVPNLVQLRSSSCVLTTFTASTTSCMTVWGQCGVPSGASAVIAEIRATVNAPAALPYEAYLYVGPGSGIYMLHAHADKDACSGCGSVPATDWNQGFVPLSGSGQICYDYANNAGSGNASGEIDIIGWMQ